jgi:hypothetical protein
MTKILESIKLPTHHGTAEVCWSWGPLNLHVVSAAGAAQDHKHQP